MTSRKKILFIITKSVWAGAGKYVYDLSVNLPKDEFEVLVAASGKGLLAEKLNQANIPYFEIKNFQRDVNFFKDFFALFEILALLKKTKPDIVHVSSSKAGGLAGLATFIYKILYSKAHTLNPKLIFTAHGWAFNEPRPKWQIALIKFFSKLTAKFYDKIICVSQFDRESALKNSVAPIEKLITIHNGINTQEVFFEKEEAVKKIQKIFNSPAFAAPSPKLWSVGDNASAGKQFLIFNSKIIGTVGEFTKNKGQKYLIEAAAEIVKKRPDTKFIIIGWGEEILNLKSFTPPFAKGGAGISNLRLENSVFLIENLNPAGPYLKAFDVFVLPSLKEGLPYTLLEAGLAELPVIATNVGGNPEIIEHQKTGLLVEPAKAEALSKALENLLAQPEFARILGSNLRQKILSEFSLERMLKETIDTYSTSKLSLDLRR